MLDKEWLKNTLEQCAEYGYRTVPFFPKGYKVNGVKMPSRKFKDGQDYKKLSQYAEAESVAIVLDDLVLLDYDGNKGEIMSIEELEEALDLDLVGMPTMAQVNDAGDSIHWIFKLPEGVTGLADSCDGAWPHIDIKRGNQLMHLKPHKTLNLVARDEWEECPEAIIEKLKSGKGVSVVGADDMGLWEAVEAQEERMPIKELKRLIDALPISRADDHQSWYNVGMAIWYETHGSEEGLELFKEFSKQSDKYDEVSLESRWPSFKHSEGRKPITGGSLHYWAEEAEFDNRIGTVNAYIDKIKQADEKHLLRDLPKEIGRLDLDSFDREKLAVAIQARGKELTGAKMPLPDARSLVAPKVSYGELTDDMPRPEWCEPWVWVGTHGQFFHLGVKRELSTETFNMEFTKLVPVANDSGQKASATRFVMNHGFVEVADRLEYLPMESARLLEIEGSKIFNSFNERTLPKFDNQCTEEGLEAVNIIRQHIKIICNDSATDALIFEQWFAHQIQHKGVKILWCPLICSIEGTGKSIMGDLLRMLLGKDNVKTVEPDQVKDKNKASWAIGSCVNILNELKITGMTRHEIANSLKPIISDTHIRVEDKYVKSFEARNTANYLAFTNYVDAVPLTESSRRWWPVRMNIDNLNDIGRSVGLSKDQYFDRLTNAIRTQWKQIGFWLSDYEISEEFKALKQAPETQFKLDMVATERSTVDYMDEIIDILDRGKRWVHPKCVCIKDLITEISMDPDMDVMPKTGEVKWILKRLGFTSRSTQVTIDGETKRVWTKGDLTNDDIKALYSH